MNLTNEAEEKLFEEQESREEELLLSHDLNRPKGYTKSQAWQSIKRHLIPIRKEIIFLLVLGVISAAANGSVPYITGQFFDALIALSVGNEGVWGEFSLWSVLLTLWVLLQFSSNIIDWHMRNRQESTWLRMRLTIESLGFIHLLRLPLAYHKQHSIGGSIDIVNTAGWRISAALRSILEVAPQFLSMVIGIILAASIHKTLAGILFIGVFIYSVILYKMLRPIAAMDDHAHRLWNQNWQKTTEKIHAAEAVKQASAEQYEAKSITRALLGRVFQVWSKMEKHWGNISFWQRMIVFATQLFVFVFSIDLIKSQQITVGELIAVNAYAQMFFGPLVQLGYSWQNIQNGITSAVHAEEIMNKEEEIYEPIDAAPRKRLSGSVTFENVSFQYEPDQPLVLSEMNFHTEPGDIIALVGESGGGKSTAISLISAYYFPTEGSVLVDGIDTKRFALHDLRRSIAVVPQEVTLFNNTLRYNLSYGAPGATQEDIERVIADVHLEGFIASLPKGYDTMVGEKGLKLSVGQKQRVSIARAMLRDPAILILDEPTSALDAQTEHFVTGALERLMKGRTTFIIAHRLSTVRRAKNILVFDKGRIAESGTHDELIKKEGGVYRNLHDHQIGLFG